MARFGILIEQGFRAHDHTGGAIAALDRTFLDKSTLYGMQFLSLRKTFDRLDRPAVSFDSQDETGIHRLTVEQHGTGTAVAQTAAFFCARQAQFAAQQIDECQRRFHRDFVATAVHFYIDQMFQSVAFSVSGTF